MSQRIARAASVIASFTAERWSLDLPLSDVEEFLSSLAQRKTVFELVDKGILLEPEGANLMVAHFCTWLDRRFEIELEFGDDDHDEFICEFQTALFGQQ